ncbi:hypothetical protein TRVL_03468 [Trypanosoma vivax]|nr:hypothetical protein TRVL_03468 [Trypanosoma vivax]
MPIPTTAVPLLMSKNVMIDVSEETLLVYCDLHQNSGQSSTGRSIIIATSGGNKPLGDTGSYMCLNLFCHSFSSVRLDDEAIAAPRNSVVVGNCCDWYVTDDRVLCLRVYFGKMPHRKADITGAYLLASSGGNRQLGLTGIFFGFNCHQSRGRDFVPSSLRSAMRSSIYEVGESAEIGEGFSLTVESRTQVNIHFESPRSAIFGILKAPMFLLNNKMTLALQIKRSGTRKVRTNKRVKRVMISKCPGFVKPSSLARNTLMRYETRIQNNQEVIVVDIRFDPTRLFSSNEPNKSMIVAKSGGWCEVDADIFISFVAQRTPESLTSAEMLDAVTKVLSTYSKEALAQISFKDVVEGITRELEVDQEYMGGLKSDVVTAVIKYLKERGY